MPRLAAFRFFVPQELRGRKLSVIREDIERMQKCPEEGFICPIETNYGCAGFEFSSSGDLIHLVFSMLDFDVKYDELEIDEIIKALAYNLERLRKVNEFLDKLNVEEPVSASRLDYDVIEFNDSEIEEALGFTIEFCRELNPEQKLLDLERDVDKSIGSIKRYLTQASRTDLNLRRMYDED